MKKNEQVILERELSHISSRKNVKMTSIICLTLLGISTIVGIFFGREGLVNLVIGVSSLIIFVFVMALMSVFNDN